MLPLLAVALAAFVADRITKIAIEASLPVNTSRPVVDGVLYFTHTQNSGAAFSLGRSFGGFYLVFALAAAVAILVISQRLPRRELLIRIGMGLILGGALGNALDRVISSSVTDFIDVRFWPVFNVADSCISVGALILVVALWRRERGKAPTG